VFQLIAWGTMLPTYSIEAGSWNRGVTDTFSGEKPCQLCVAIQETQQEEQKRPRATRVKLEFACGKGAESMQTCGACDYGSEIVYFPPQQNLQGRWMSGVEVPPPELS